MSRIPKRKRKLAIWQRDKFRCGYCGRPVETPSPDIPKYLWATVDHKVPRSAGGGNKEHNLLTACVPCNKRKADLDYQAFVESGKAALSNNGGFRPLSKLASAMSAGTAETPESGSGRQPASAVPKGDARTRSEHMGEGLAMGEWASIETAPKDGTLILAKRVYKGRLVKKGYTRWGINSPDAPMRQWTPGGLDGPIPPSPEYADTTRWVTEDGMYSFPTPTHWKPAPPARHAD